MEWLKLLLSTDGFKRPTDCGGWTHLLEWAIRASDGMIFFAFLVTSILLWQLSRQSEVPAYAQQLTRWLGGTIFLCGLTHLWRNLLFSYPAYRFQAVLNWITVIAAVGLIAVAVPMYLRGDYKRGQTTQDVIWGVLDGIIASIRKRDQALRAFAGVMKDTPDIETENLRRLLEALPDETRFPLEEALDDAQQRNHRTTPRPPANPQA